MDELDQTGLAAKGFRRVIAVRQLGLAKLKMDLVVADLVQQHRFPTLATLQFRDQVMTALCHIWRNHAPAKRAFRQGSLAL